MVSNSVPRLDLQDIASVILYSWERYEQLQKYASNLSTFIYLKVGRRKMSEPVQLKGKIMRNTFRYTGVLQNPTQELIDRRT